MARKSGIKRSMRSFEKFLSHMEKELSLDQLAQRRMVRSCKVVGLDLSGGLEPDTDDTNPGLFEPEKGSLQPTNRLFEGEGQIVALAPEGFEARPTKDQGGMDPNKIGSKLDCPVKGVEEILFPFSRKAQHQMKAHFETTLPKPRNGKSRILARMASVGEGENPIHHGLSADLDGSNPMVLKKIKGFVIEAIGPGRNPNRIDLSG